MRKGQLRGLRVVRLPQVLLICGVVRACHADVVSCETRVHALIFEIVALGDIEDEAVATDVNFSTLALAVVFADLVEGPGRDPIVRLFLRLCFWLFTAK